MKYKGTIYGQEGPRHSANSYAPAEILLFNNVYLPPA